MKKFNLYLVVFLMGAFFVGCNDSAESETVATPEVITDSPEKKKNRKGLQEQVPATIDELEVSILKRLSEKLEPALTEEQIQRIRTIRDELKSKQEDTRFSDMRKIRRKFMGNIKDAVLTPEQRASLEAGKVGKAKQG